MKKDPVIVGENFPKTMACVFALTGVPLARQRYSVI